MKWILAMGFTLICCLSLSAGEYVTERISLHADQIYYESGENLQFYGRITRTDSIAMALSRYVYVEMLDQRDSVLVRQKYACDNGGTFQGCILLSPQWKKNVYYLRAYTRLMQNFSAATFPIIPIGIGCKFQEKEKVVTALNCSFFAEGGAMVSRSAQNVAAYLTDANNQPVSKVELTLMHHNDTLFQQRSDDSGMALFSFTPTANEEYMVYANLNGNSYKFAMPSVQPDACALQLMVNGHRAVYRLLGKRPGGKLHLLCFHDDMGLRELPLSENGNGIIDLKGIRMCGILSLFLTDEEGDILSQRCVSVDDSHDTEYLWRYDLLSAVPFPKSTNRKTLQAWLLSTRFERFNAAKVSTEGFVYTYPYEDTLVLRGRLTTSYGRPFREGVVNAFCQATLGSGQSELDENGRFAIAVPDFEDGQEFFISAQVGKKWKNSGFFKYQMDDEIYPAVINPHKVLREQTYTDSQVEVLGEQTSFRFDDWNDLPGITVKARARIDDTPDMQTKRFYQNHYISLYDKDGQFTNLKSVIDRIPTLVFERYMSEGKVDNPFDPRRSYDGYTYTLHTTRGISTLSKSNEVLIKLDGYFITAEELWNLDPYQLEDVEYLTPREALREVPGGIYGLLVLRSRKNSNQRKEEHKAKGIWFAPMGLTKLGA